MKRIFVVTVSYRLEIEEEGPVDALNTAGSRVRYGHYSEGGTIRSLRTVVYDTGKPAVGEASQTATEVTQPEVPPVAEVPISEFVEPQASVAAGDDDIPF